MPILSQPKYLTINVESTIVDRDISEKPKYTALTRRDISHKMTLKITGKGA
jgi:hypothetical protein